MCNQFFLNHLYTEVMSSLSRLPIKDHEFHGALYRALGIVSSSTLPKIGMYDLEAFLKVTLADVG